MPVRTAFLSTICRLAVYVAALVVLATARPPHARMDTSVNSLRLAEPATPSANTTWRLVIAGILLSGAALEIHRRRVVWH